MGDELCIGAISSRKSYIGTFVWTDEDLSMSQVLWNSTVSPNLGVALGSIPSLVDPTFDQNVFQDSALAFSSRPFTFWRGSINFTFEVVCSRFHRGKLLIRYEPNIRQYDLTETMLFFKQALLGGVAVPVSGFDDIDINEIGISVQPSDILGATFTAQGFLYV